MSNNFYNRGFACATPTIRGNHKRWTCATWSTPRWGDERRRQQITIDVRRWAEPIDQLSQRVAVAGLNRPTRIVVVSLTLFVRNFPSRTNRFTWRDDTPSIRATSLVMSKVAIPKK